MVGKMVESWVLFEAAMMAAMMAAMKVGSSAAY